MNVQIVSFYCVLKDKMGNVISSTFNREVLTCDGAKSAQPVLSGLIKGLQDIKTGEVRKISVPAEQAYGFYDPDRVLECSYADISRGKKIRVGEKILLRLPSGEEDTYRVTEITGDTVTLDANHPLAGRDLIFEVRATAARDATPEEISDSVMTEDGPLLH